jgi:hypothetical protein
MSEIALQPILPMASVAAPLSVVAVARMPPEIAGMTAGTILTGVVAGREPGGQTVIRTQYGALILKGGALPVGGTVTLQLQQVGAQLQVAILSVAGGGPAQREAAPVSVLPGPAHGTPQAADEAVRMLAGHWDALAQALAATPDLARFVPRPGAEMAALTLTLVGALKRGVLADWFDRSGLRALAPPLAARLASDFASMGRLATTDVVPWRFIPIPLLHDGQLEQALLFVRHGHHHDGTPDDEAGTRILVDIERSRFGRIQIDALIRPSRLDLIVRSQTPLTSPLRDRLTAVHDETCALAGLAGAIGFQPADSFVAPPLPPHAFGVTA